VELLVKRFHSGISFTTHLSPPLVLDVSQGRFGGLQSNFLDEGGDGWAGEEALERNLFAGDSIRLFLTKALLEATRIVDVTFEDPQFERFRTRLSVPSLHGIDFLNKI